MRFQCPGCGGALEYNALMDKMLCSFCGSTYEVGEFDLKEENDAKGPETVPIMAQDILECKVFSCSSCGAEILINGVETSKFCAFCGQPAISFDRIAGELKPDYILPFKISKEHAMNKMSETIRKAKIEPEKIENFKVEHLRGIYMPYRLYDIEYYDDQIWRKKKEGTYVRTSKSYIRKARYTFRDLAVPTASRLNNEITQRLEPYDMSCKVPFDSEYLSGYYADRYDMSALETNLTALRKAKELFNAGVCMTIDSSDPGELSFTRPEVDILGSSYVLVPAWFMTVQLEGETYTLVMNGQTGKIAGALPVSKKRESVYFIALALSFATICIALFSAWADMRAVSPEVNGWSGVICRFIIGLEVILFVMAYNKFVAVRKTYQKMRSRVLSNLVRER